MLEKKYVDNRDFKIQVLENVQLLQNEMWSFKKISFFVIEKYK